MLFRFFFFFFIKGARQTPEPNIDIIDIIDIIDREREEEEKVGFDYGTVVSTAHDIFVKFFEKKSEAGNVLEATNGVFFATFNGFIRIDIGAPRGAVLATVYGLFDRIFVYLCAPHIGACRATFCGLFLAPIGEILATITGLFGGLHGHTFEHQQEQLTQQILVFMNFYSEHQHVHIIQQILVILKD